MIDRLGLQPDDRILLLSIPDIERVFALAARLESGVVVALGNREDVHRARRAASNCVNIMFHPGPPEEVPFQDGFFTKVIDWSCSWSDPDQVAREIVRVLRPGGSAYLVTSAIESLLNSDLVQVGSVDEFLVFEKPQGTNEGPADEPFLILR